MKKLTYVFLLFTIAFNCLSQDFKYLDEKGKSIILEEVKETDFVQGEVLIKFKENAADEQIINRF